MTQGMMWHKAQAQLGQSAADRPAKRWCHFNFHFANMSRRVGAWGIRCPKSVEAELGGWSATCTASQSRFGELLSQINGGAHSLHLEIPPIPLRRDGDQKVWFSFL
jgi:hypothetical protein